MESTLITVKNLFSVKGIKYIIGNAVSNFKNFDPLVLIIISTIGVGICEKTGFIYAITNPFKRIKFSIIIFFTVLIGIMSSIIGDSSYVLLIPLFGVIYKGLEKNPMIGILAVYLGITIGYGTGIIFDYNSYLFGNLTEKAAALDVDPNFHFSLTSDIYIMIISTLIVALILTILINKFLVPVLKKKYEVEEELIQVDTKAAKITLILDFLMLFLVVYMLLPIKLPGAGLLLDNEATRYMDKLFGENSPFREGILLIITIIMMISGFVYGKLSNNIKNSTEFGLGLSKNLENLGFLFVLLFFLCQLSAIIDWTNIGEFICSRLIELISNTQLSGIILIVTFVIIVIVSSILLPDGLAKWQLMSPTIVPLFMRSNITPEFTQFIFMVSDGIGKSFSPIFVYFIMTIAFLEKYRVNEKKKISLFGTMKLIMPIISIMTVVWILIIGLWYLIGIPIGIGTSTTL